MGEHRRDRKGLGREDLRIFLEQLGKEGRETAEEKFACRPVDGYFGCNSLLCGSHQ